MDSTETTYVPVEQKRLDALLDSEKLLTALETYGVDNWEGYDDAMYFYREGKDRHE